MRLATWNVNSLRVRLPHVLQWLQDQQPDVLCLQETKLIDANFPAEAIRAAGYDVAYAGQKTYNGVATLTRRPLDGVITDLPGLDDPQRRLLGVTVGDLRILNVYVPNGSAVGSEKYAYKLKWLDRLAAYVRAELAAHPALVVLGDYNVAPADEDVYDPELWEGSVLVSEPEREAFQELLAQGLHDVFRKFEQAPGSFTWWDYRGGAFRRNHGLRIDHILASEPLARACSACSIDTGPRRLERPSDHAPVIADFDD